MNLTGRPVANFDPEGLIFAAGISSETIKLYDLRSFEKVQFQSFLLNLNLKHFEISFFFFFQGSIFQFQNIQRSKRSGHRMDRSQV